MGERPAPVRRPAPQTRPPQQNRPAPAYGAFARQRKKRVSNENLLLTLIILSVVLAVLIAAFIIIKTNDGKPEGEAGAESSSDPSVQAGVVDPPEESSESNNKDPADPAIDSFKPVSDSSTVDLAANEIYSDYIIMVDAESGRAVCQHNPDATIYPASMTKIMTAIVACDLITDMNATFTLTNEIIALIEPGAALANFEVGKPIPMKDLIYGTLLPSGADATAGLAIALAGSEAEFVKLMNKKAEELGCSGTNFVNTSGLHDKNHYSTVRDMAAIMACAMNDPFLKEVMATESYTPAASLKDNRTSLKSTWKGQLGPYVSKTATMYAAKTGWTPEAGNCLASLSVTEDGKEFIIISAKATTNQQITGKNQAFSDAAKLCDKYII